MQLVVLLRKVGSLWLKLPSKSMKPIVSPKITIGFRILNCMVSGFGAPPVPVELYQQQLAWL
jgi:hypothetical protein